MKFQKFFLITLIIFLVLCSINISFLSGLNDGAGSVSDKIKIYSEKEYWKERLDYLGREWKSILTRNPLVNSLDSFFRKISVVFFILFGIPYEFSITLFFVIFLWIFFWNVVDNLLKGLELIPRLPSLILSVLFTISLSQLGIFLNLANFIKRIIFSPEGAWARLVLFLGILFIFFIVRRFSYVFSKYLMAMKKKNEEELEKLNRDILGRFVNAFIKSSK